ncbi:MAG: preprotein translocase subunit YajC [Desulfovibrio sp.]|nr:preprotein translocase subunit YajC [Desulfovibrio sp.]
MFDSLAFAMGTPQAGAPAGGMGMLASFMPFILMFVIFWFLLIRPQQKRAKAHREMLENLQRGNRVITQSGLIGRIIELDKDEVLIECGESKLLVSRQAIGGVLDTKEKKDKKERKKERAEAKNAEDAKQSDESATQDDGSSKQ